MLTGRQNASRGSRASASHTRGTMRGGVRKNRSSATRIDRDGDLMMDSETGNRMIDGNESKRGSGRSQIDHIVSTRSMGLKGGSNRGPKSGLRRAQQSILRGIRAQQSSSLASLEVTGLSLSKASAHDDGGLESLLGFLERKASGLDSKSNRSIRIRKVRLLYGDGIGKYVLLIPYCACFSGKIYFRVEDDHAALTNCIY